MAQERRDAPVARIESAGESLGAHADGPSRADGPAKAPVAKVAPAAGEATRTAVPGSTTATASASTADEPAAGAPAQAAPNAPGVLERVCTWFAETFPNSRHAVLGGIAGLVVAIMLFTVGVLRTLVILVLVIVGVAAGQYLDGDPKLVRLFQSLTKRR